MAATVHTDLVTSHEHRGRPRMAPRRVGAKNTVGNNPLVKSRQNRQGSLVE